MVCRECATENPDAARFCLNCGARLARSSAEELGAANLEPYLPRGMLAKLEGARLGRSMEGERRIVTMLFCDVKGSTAMAETLDPEEWAEIMNGAFELLIAPVYRYEGTLARLMGDAIFAFFGAPIAHEDDPERAIAAGLEIVDGITGYRERVMADRGLDLNIRVGINTGPVVVGQVGSDLRLEYTAMGDAVNVAARMEQTAEPGTVQITAATYRSVEGLFEMESRGGIEVKGKTEPVEAYRVLRRKLEPGPMRRMRRSPLVGREREMTRLQRAVDETIDGRGQMVSLVGEAGLGKTRLIEEARAAWDERRPDDAHPAGDIRRIWETWQCVSYDTTRPYAQYRRMLARIAGVVDSDPPEIVRQKLIQTIDPRASEWREPHMRVWRSLFGVPEPEEELLEGEAFRRAIMELVPGSTRHFSSDPRLMVFEDLHWCDEASMDLLIETAKLVDDLPCLFLFAFRPDRQASSWRLKQWLETEYPHRSIQIALSPLTPEESGVLIDELLPNGDSSNTLRAQILARSDGNPLFVEEIATALSERGSAGADDVTVPASLQALITARLDTLDEETRRALQLASVIGRTFAEPVLRAIWSESAELGVRLRTLERVGLIVETARTPQHEYAFHHSLTQEATYGTILLRTRRELHQRVGEALEALYENRIEEHAPVLVRHFLGSGDDERTLSYATMAGRQAARLYANAEAVTHFSSAIRAAERLRRTEELLHDLYPGRGRALELSGRYDEAIADYEVMQAIAADAGDRTAILDADLALATLYSTPTPRSDPKRGRDLSERALNLARELGERGAESKALWNLMLVKVFGGGDLGEALDAGERSLVIARELDLREQIAFTLNDLWRPYAAIGDMATARGSLEEATPIWRELGNLPMLSENLSSLGTLRWLAGDEHGALELSEEALRISGDIGNLWGQAYVLMLTYRIYMDRGEIGKTIATMETCITTAERGGFIPPQATVRADLASLLANLGNLERARELVRLALDVAVQRQPIALPWVIGVQAEVHMLAGELDEAEAAMAQMQVELLPEPLRSVSSIQIALVSGRVAAARGDPSRAVEIADAILDRLRRSEIRQFVADALLLKGTSLAAADAAGEAERLLQEARSAAEELGCARILWEVLLELSRLAAARRNDQEATQLQAEARRLVKQIAESIDDDDLRSNFVSSTGVKP